MPDEQQDQDVKPTKPPLKILYSALDNYGGYPFHSMFDAVQAAYNPDDLSYTNSALVIWGGGDISPGMYGQIPGKRTGATAELSSKDQLELALAGRAIKLGIPIIGICRGAQMMCAVAGGKLVQDITGHTSNHEILTDENKTIMVTSLHHQMMFPWETEHKLIAWSSPLKSKHYLGELNPKTGDDIPVDFPETVEPELKEPEIVYFPTIKSLAIQGHPEFVRSEKNDFVQYCLALVDQYLVIPFLK